MANVVRTVSRHDDKTSGPLDRIRQKFELLQKQGAKGFAIGAGAAITTKAFSLLGSGISRVTDFLGNSVGAASDLNETLSKSRIIFGPAAKDMERFGDRAARALGLSKTAAIEAGATFGNFFVGLGQGQSDAEKMSERLVGLAGDLASFNNLDPTDVLDKLRSGLAGEAEPLRRLGVFLSEAKVKAKAMELGLAGANGELSEGAKVLARYHLILGETKTAQGDFARTSDGLANQQRILNAEFENMQAKIGEKLTPAVHEFNRVLLMALDSTAISLRNLEGAAEGGSQAAAARLRAVAAVAQEAGITIERAWQLAGEGVALNADAMRAAVDTSTTEMVRSFRAHQADLGTAAESGAKRVGRALPAGIRAATPEMREAARRSVAAYAQTLRGGWDSVQSAWQSLKEAMKEPLSGAKRIAELEGILASKRLAKGLRSNDPLIRAESLALKQQVEDELITLRDATRKYGYNAANQYAKGIRDGTINVTTAALLLSTKVANILKLSSPAKEGPLSEKGGPEGWGRRGAELFAKGWGSVAPTSSLDRLAGAAVGGATSGGAPSSGSPVVLQINLDGREVARVVERHLRLAAPRSQYLPD